LPKKKKRTKKKTKKKTAKKSTKKKGKKKKCAGKTKSGKKCKSYASGRSKYCVAHKK
jgi:hypothetical protein